MKILSNKSKISVIFAVVRSKSYKWIPIWLNLYYLVKKIIAGLFDLLFPGSNPRWTKSRNLNTNGFSYANILSEKNESGNKTYAGVAYFTEYRIQVIKKMLWQFKYYLNHQAITQCTYILYDELVAEISDHITQIPFHYPIPLVHCPSSTYFKGNKDFDHMKELVLMFDTLQNSTAPFFICCTHAILPNQKFSAGEQAQHTGTRTQRFKWASERFSISEKFENYLRENSDRINTIYCIDDVVTTGASLNAVANMIENNYNVEVKSFCLCH